MTHRHGLALRTHTPWTDEVLGFHAFVEQLKTTRTIFLNADRHGTILLGTRPNLASIVARITPL